MNWKLKSMAFRALSAMPGGTGLHYAAQRYVTRNLPRRPASLDALWRKAESLIADYRAHANQPLESATFLEFGAGRDLAVPIALRLQGVARVISIDIEPLARLDLVLHAARHYFNRMTAPSRLASWDDLRDFGVDYRAPSGVEDVSTHVDCVCSNEVLEHIDRASLERIAAHSLKLVRLSGLGVHSIDYGDHFARSDQAIDRFNFLRFDASEWARHNSRMQYVNRLRPSDYEALFADAGWKIRSALRTPGRPTTTTRENVASEFRHYEDADLFALSGRIVLSA